jgi:signal transduction histidine kinase/ActR/RegA family two-component response regulator
MSGPLQQAADVEAVLAGGGEMGALVRSVDWSTTSLGLVSGWSEALRTTVGLLLRNFEEARAKVAGSPVATKALQADGRKNEFLAMLGHELRNPLAPIITAVKLMQLKGDDRLKRERQVIERQVAHLARLVDDLLDVTRIAQGKIELARRTVDLAEVAAGAIEQASPIFENKSQQLTIQVPRGELYVDADPIRLAQVIGNLLTNAGKYTPPHGHIALSAAREGSSVAIRVKDDGNGITPELLPRVFDLFVQSARASDRAEGGLGLGLALVKNLVSLHGGQASASSEGPGRGSEFVVRLPLVELNAQARPGRPPLEALVRPEAARVCKILVVDDNIDAAEMLAEFFTAMGHRVKVAHDGPEALIAQASFHPDVGVLDLGLPVMDGYELALRMRMVAGAPLRLVALTGYGQEEDRQRSRKAGFDAHLVKPVELEELIEVISGLRSELEIERLPAHASETDLGMQE